jgi:hypothetical protein
MTFEDGREERLDALLLERRLASNPNATARHKEYQKKVAAARDKALSMSKQDVIEALCVHNPAYIRTLLETEDARFGNGALAERYACTFWNHLSR